MQSDPSLAGIREHCIGLIHDSKVMTLGTSDAMTFGTSKLKTLGTGTVESPNAVWTAPVYYIFRDGRFYFFSNPRSRHIRQGDGWPAAASIFKDASDFSQLKGLQMSGLIEHCAKGKHSIGAALDYVGKFGICPDPGNILTFFKTRFNASLYRFTPKETFYMDNARGIGTRTGLEL